MSFELSAFAGIKFVRDLNQNQSLELFRQVLDSSYDSILITSPDLDEPEIVYVNPAFCQMTGYDAEDVIGRTPKMLQGSDTDQEVTAALKASLQSGESYEAHAINYRKDGTAFHMQWRTSPVFDDDGRVILYMAIQRDVTEQVHLIERLKRDAMIDGLTGLFNRGAGEKALGELLEAAYEQQEPLSLVLFDLDHFKEINDRHGHLVGDQVLRRVARIIDGRTRGNDLVIRWGGEEFVVALWATTIDGAHAVARAIRRAVQVARIEPVDSVTLSGGVTEWEPGTAMTELIDRADRCLYEAKSAGRNQIRT
jgi:diguanylate cyclase (GGDEF)-like protein/PAS domain S-box-containing protein